MNYIEKLYEIGKELRREREVEAARHVDDLYKRQTEIEEQLKLDRMTYAERVEKDFGVSINDSEVFGHTIGYQIRAVSERELDLRQKLAQHQITVDNKIRFIGRENQPHSLSVRCEVEGCDTWSEATTHGGKLTNSRAVSEVLTIAGPWRCAAHRYTDMHDVVKELGEELRKASRFLNVVATDSAGKIVVEERVAALDPDDKTRSWGERWEIRKIDGDDYPGEGVSAISGGGGGFFSVTIDSADLPERISPWKDRHHSIKHFEPLFEFEHLPKHLQHISRMFSVIAETLLGKLKDGPELTTSLRKLVESKDAAVRQAVIDNKTVEK